MNPTYRITKNSELSRVLANIKADLANLKNAKNKSNYPNELNELINAVFTFIGLAKKNVIDVSLK